MDIRISRSIKSFIAFLLFYGGVNFLYEKIKYLTKRGKIKILCFHDVIKGYPDNFSIVEHPEIFEKQINFLSRRFQVVDIAKATELIEKEESIPYDVFALTLDDCYKSFLTEVLPVCEKREIPFTVFLTTAPLDNRKLLPYDSLRLLVVKTTKEEVDLTSRGLSKYPLKTQQNKFDFMNSIMAYLIPKSLLEQEKIINLLCEKLEVLISPDIVEDFLLCWNDVRMLSRHNIVTIGSHTENHLRLPTLSEHDCMAEIMNSKQRLESVLDKKINFFSYPFGDKFSYNEITANLVDAAGFRNAYTLEWRSVERVKKFMIPRFNINNGSCLNGRGQFSKALFAVEMSGLGDWVFGRKIQLRKIF